MKKEKKYVYKTPCGKEVSVPVDAHECRVIIGWEYENCTEYENAPINEECAKCTEHKKAAHSEVFSKEYDKTYKRTMWACTAKSAEKKYESLQEPFHIECMDPPAMNLERDFTIEIIMQREDFRKVFYHHTRGEYSYQPMTELEEILEEIYNKQVDEEGVCEFLMNSVETGEILPINFDGFDDFYDSLASARIIKYSSKIIPEGKGQ